MTAPLTHSQHPTKCVLNQAHTQFDPTHFMHGACHTLAYSMWLANERRGQLVACMNSIVNAETGKAESISYGHMVYEDPNGTIWDIDGPDADVRYEENRSLEHDYEVAAEEALLDDEDEFVPTTIVFDWIEIHPNNLFAFLRDWGATHPIQREEVFSLTQVFGDMPALLAANQIDLLPTPETHIDITLPPFCSAWYAAADRAGFLAGKHRQRTSPTGVLN